VCAIKNVNHIRLIYLSKNLLSFFTFNPAILIFSFFIILTARFPLFISFKYCIHLLRRERRLIRKRKDITGIIYKSAYLDIFLYKYAGACIRSAAPIRFGLAPHLPLAKTPRIPRIEYQAYLHTYTTYLSLKILSVESFRCHFLDNDCMQIL
jgi:hypothetical protein